MSDEHIKRKVQIHHQLDELSEPERARMLDWCVDELSFQSLGVMLTAIRIVVEDRGHAR